MAKIFHRHKWSFVGLVGSSLIDKDGIDYGVKDHAEYVCECGKVKTVKLEESDA